MITPLDIENKKFSKRALNGYSTEEVDDFLDEITLDYEKIYKEVDESKKTIESLNQEITKYREIESTLKNTLMMAQSAADEIKNGAQSQVDTLLNDAKAQAQTIIGDARVQADSILFNAKTESETVLNNAKSQADSVISTAQTSAQEEITKINSSIEEKQRALEDIQKQYDEFKTKMEAMLISELELLKS